MKWLRKFFKLKPKKQLYLLFTFFLTGIFRVVILLVPFKKIARIMGNSKIESRYGGTEAEIIKVDKVKWAIQTVSTFTPWQSLCYVQALTGQYLLKRARCSSTIYFGLGKNEHKDLIAHAWLRSGDVIVTGGAEAPRFKTISFYATEF